MSSDATCAIVGAAIGAGIGGLLLEGEIAGALVGGGAGAVLSGLACNRSADADGDGIPDEFDKCPASAPGSVVGPDGCALDSDGDGVPDSRDRCVSPGASAVDDDGCPLDSDGDGVPDDQDACPGTTDGPVDDRGCLIKLDGDGDGVPNALDRCPTTPPGWSVDADGCEVNISLRDIHFEFDSAALTAQSRNVLDANVVAALEARDTTSVTVVGHTDSIGTSAYNNALSKRRADSVKQYLISRGIAPGRITTQGRGETQPQASNDTAEGRAENRRVEFNVTQ